MGKLLFFLVILLISLGGIFYAHVTQHELVHVQIYKTYGIDSDWHYTYSGGYTEVTNVTEAYNCTEKCEELHLLNEIVGYNVLTILAGFCIFTIIVLVFIGLKKEAD